MEQDQIRRGFTGKIDGVEGPIRVSIPVVIDRTNIRGADVIVKHGGSCTCQDVALEYLEQLQGLSSSLRGVDINCDFERRRAERRKLRNRVGRPENTVGYNPSWRGAVHVVATDRASASEVVVTESGRLLAVCPCDDAWVTGTLRTNDIAGYRPGQRQRFCK